MAGNDLFRSLQIGAVICSASGQIEQSNDQALETFGLHDHSEIGDAKIAFENGRPFDAPFLASVRDQSNLTIEQCFHNDTVVNLAILALDNGQTDRSQYLIVFMDTPWGDEAKSLLAARFDLTDIETEIVGQFVAGVPLRQIAAERGRSYQTIRNQFQAVLEKTGCPNQADLLRLLLGTSYLFSHIQTLARELTPAPGRSIEMARPGGRFFDVQMFGDINGTPFICLPSIFGLPITPAIEAQLRAHKLLMLGIARPGFGGTSHPKSGQDLVECLAGDIVALLNSLEIDRCIFMARASAAPTFFKLASLLPDRMSHAISINGLVPRPYIKSNGVISSWTRSLMSASKVSPTIATLMLSAGNRLRLQMGTSRFFAKMYRQSSLDTAATLDPDVTESLNRGIAYVMQQGVRAGAQDMIDGFQDWRDDVAKLETPVTLIHGPDDPHVPIDAVRSFTEEFSDKLELIEFPKGGGLLNYTHTDQIFEILKAR